MTGTSEAPATAAGLLTPEELSAILTEPRLTSAGGVKVSFSMVPEVGWLAGHIHAQERQIAALREAVETEWYNGNMDEGARDRILEATS